MKSNGQIAYEGYFKACGGRSLISKALLPNWDGLDVLIKDAWEHAAKAVLDAQWHPVSEPPNDGREVLVTDGGNMDIGYFVSDDGEFVTLNSFMEITHWRELPELPKEDK